MGSIPVRLQTYNEILKTIGQRWLKKFVGFLLVIGRKKGSLGGVDWSTIVKRDRSIPIGQRLQKETVGF